MRSKPRFKGEVVNWKQHYLEIFKQLVLNQLEQGISPEQIVDFTNTLDFDIIKIDVALIAGLKKFTSKEEREQILLDIEKGK